MPSRRRRFRARPKPLPKRPPANAEIRYPEVRLIGSDGSQLGVVRTAEALEKARSEEFDLVLVAQKANPPVARIMDVGKYMYEKKKQDAKQRAKSKGGDVKGVRIGFKTDDHDWQFRLEQAAEFLEDGNKIKLEMRLRGREKQRFDQAAQKMHQFIQAIPIPTRQEDSFSRSHNSLSVILTRG